VRQRHAEHFLALAEEAKPNLAEYSDEWLDRLQSELDNLRAALDWLEASGASEHVLRLAGALQRFWDERGHLAEGRRRLEAALGSDSRPTRARARALNAAADMAVSIGDAATARRRAEEALALHRTFEDALGTAVSSFLLGLAVADERDYSAAKGLFEESAQRFRDLGDEHTALVVTRMEAWMCYSLGDRERGRALHEDNLRRARAIGSKRIEASALGALAMIAVDDGRVDDALSLLRESEQIDRDLRDPIGIARYLSRTARVLAAVGRAESAARLLSASSSLHEQLGASVRPWLAELNEVTLTTIQAQLEEGDAVVAWEAGRALTADEAVALAGESLFGKAPAALRTAGDGGTRARS
jgi:non-specific serine/threonine protein kinase